MKKTSIILGIVTVLILIFSAIAIIRLMPKPEPVIPESEETKGYYYSQTTADEIVLESPVPEAPISSPLQITGRARGTWFFEATAPVVLTDWDGLIIAQGYITAQDEWMTEEFVPFSGTLTFKKPAYGTSGSLILRADNPSDLPQYDRALEIPIQFR